MFFSPKLCTRRTKSQLEICSNSQGTLHHFVHCPCLPRRPLKPVCLSAALWPCISDRWDRVGGFPGERAVFGAGDAICSPLYPPENWDSGNAGSYGAALCGCGIVLLGSQDQTSNITSPCCCTHMEGDQLTKTLLVDRCSHWNTCELNKHSWSRVRGLAYWYDLFMSLWYVCSV